MFQERDRWFHLFPSSGDIRRKYSSCIFLLSHWKCGGKLDGTTVVYGVFHGVINILFSPLYKVG